jgi:hypothetical protein
MVHSRATDDRESRPAVQEQVRATGGTGRAQLAGLATIPPSVTMLQIAPWHGTGMCSVAWMFC